MASKNVAAVEGNLYRAGLAIKHQEAWARAAKICVDFLEGRQHDEAALAALRAQGRPHLTINKIRPLYRLIYGSFCQQKLDITFRPGNDGLASGDNADVLTKLVKNINDRNDFQFLQGDIFTDGVGSGRGWVDCRADFSRYKLGELKLTSRDPFRVFPDPEAETYDPADWGYVVESRWMSLADIEVYYGKRSRKAVERATPPDGDGHWQDVYWYGSEVSPETHFGLLEAQERARTDAGMWQGHGGTSLDIVDPNRKLIRVIDCQWRTRERRQQFVDIMTGATSLIPSTWGTDKVEAALQWNAQANAQLGMPQTLIVEDGPVWLWRWTVTAGDQLLQEVDSIYSAPTMVLYAPYFRRGVTHGMVHDLVDPQREINKRRMAFAEIISRTANGGWLIPNETVGDAEKAHWVEHSSTPGANLYYNAVGGVKPEPIMPAAAPAAYAQLEAAATEDLYRISNVNEAALGEAGSAQESGRALIAKQRGAAIAIQSYHDAFARTLTIVGRRERQAIAAVYTEERMFRERGDDGRDQEHTINAMQADGRILFDVVGGEYDTLVEVSPISATAADAEFETYLELRGVGMPIPDRFMIDAAPIRRKREVIDEMMAQAAVLGPSGGMPPPVPKGGAGAGKPSGTGNPGQQLGQG